MSKIILASVAFFATLGLNGCGNKFLYKEVKVPVRCDIPERAKPKKQANTIQYLKDVLIYSELLEQDLYFCRTGEIKK